MITKHGAQSGKIIKLLSTRKAFESSIHRGLKANNTMHINPRKDKKRHFFAYNTMVMTTPATKVNKKLPDGRTSCLFLERILALFSLPANHHIILHNSEVGKVSWSI